MSQIKTKEIVNIKEKITTPTLYRVMLINNPVTHFDAVIDTLVTVFAKNRVEAQEIMWYCHKNGQGLVIINSKEMCEHLVEEAAAYCKSKRDDVLMAYEYLEFEVIKDE